MKDTFVYMEDVILNILIVCFTIILNIFIIVILVVVR